MKAPDIKTALPGPKARAIIEKDTQFVSPSYTRDYPFVIARGEGAVVEDVDGNRFLDCAAGIAVNSTGVSHPEVVKAIADSGTLQTASVRLWPRRFACSSAASVSAVSPDCEMATTSARGLGTVSR